MPSTEEVVEALRQVEDPELGMDIVELGLFYGAEVEGDKVKVTYSLTSMGCPAGAMIQEDIERVVRRDSGCRRGRERAHVRPALDAGPDVRRRQVHSRLRIRVVPKSSEETDRAVEELKRSAPETTERVKKLDEHADFVQRRLAAVC